MLTLKTMGGALIPLTEIEAKTVRQSIANGDKYLPIKGNFINVSCIEGIFTDQSMPITEGRLHDGTKVVKKFGRWVDKNNPNLRLSARHYPEIALDTVMSEAEWQGKQEVLTDAEKPKQLN